MNAPHYYQFLRKRLANHCAYYGIKDPKVLKAISTVPRHKFVPKKLQNRAYQDMALPIDCEKTISQPSLVAEMTELLELTGNETVLEIGTGSGYQAAILGKLAKTVWTVECVPKLAQQSRLLLKKLGYDNIHVIEANGTLGLPDQAPFDRIIVTASSEKIPRPLKEQLANNGIMIIPIGDQNSWQKLVVARKKDKKITIKKGLIVRFIPLMPQ